MVDFRKKTIGPKDAFGSIFRRRRAELGMSLGTAAKRTNIQRHYLAALEEGRYGELPGLVYGKSFVRVYGALLRLSVAPLLRAFIDEYTVVQATRRATRSAKQPERNRVLITPFRVRLSLAAVLLLVLGIYFGGEVFRFIHPPYLIVESPADQMITANPEIQVSGNVDPRAAITVNDMSVTNDNGSFSAKEFLEQGVNTLRIRAFRRHGRDTTVVRTVIRTGDGLSLK